MILNYNAVYEAAYCGAGIQGYNPGSDIRGEVGILAKFTSFALEDAMTEGSMPVAAADGFIILCYRSGRTDPLVPLCLFSLVVITISPIGVGTVLLIKIWRRNPCL